MHVGKGNPAMRDMHSKYKINVMLKGIQMKNKLRLYNGIRNIIIYRSKAPLNQV